jgi:hypothetical protein
MKKNSFRLKWRQHEICADKESIATLKKKKRDHNRMKLEAEK